VRTVIVVGVVVATALVFSSAWFLLRPYLYRVALARTTVIAVVSGGLILLGLTPVRILLSSALVGALIGGKPSSSGSS